VWDRAWEGSAPEFTLSWGIHAWTLKVDEPNPGLRRHFDQSCAKLLFLERLSAAGREAVSLFSGATLAQVQKWRNLVEATFVPADWAGLRVRACWSPALAGAAVDLQIQVTAQSVGELTGFEVGVGSVWLAGAEGLAAEISASPDRCSESWAVPERHHAGEARSPLSSNVDHMAGRWRPPVEPYVALVPEVEPNTYYVEMVHSSDVARWTTRQPSLLPAPDRVVIGTRYGLFGHDLEKGVVLRARLRGCFVRTETPEEDARALWRSFHSEPLPLGP
jgi:hypothetical protein